MKSKVAAILAGIVLVALLTLQKSTVYALAPIFNAQAVSIPESAGLNDPATPKLSAIDPEDGTNLKFTEEAGGSGAALFKVDLDGTIRLDAAAGSLDFEGGTKSYTLNVRAEDVSAPIESSVATVTINVTDVSDEPPVMANQTFSVNENSANDTVVGTIAVTDLDASDDGSTFTFEITGGNDSNAFKINNSTREIRVNTSSALDYENKASYTLAVKVKDPGNNSDTADLTVNINNVNEAPVFATPIPSRSVSEAAPNTTPVGAPIQATDPEGNTFSFSIVGSTPFAINASTGQIAVANTSLLDFEAQPSIKITVRATDTGTPPKFADAEVTIGITDANDPPKTTGIPNQVVNNPAVPTTINLRDYFSDDDDVDSALTYTIQTNSNPGLFASVEIDTNDVLKLTYKLDAAGISNITVRVFDPQGAWVDSTFKVDINDAPTTSGIADFTVPEDAANTSINLNNVFDDAEDNDDELTYSIVSNSNAGLVAASITSPNLILDYAENANGNATIKVKATDTGGLSVETSFKVTVTPVNDKPTTGGINDVQVPEDTEGRDIDLWKAFGDIEDSDAELTYTIEGNTNTNLFIGGTPSIVQNAQGATLSLKFKPNTSGESTLTIRATDQGVNGVDKKFVDTSFKVIIGSAADKPVVSDFSKSTDEDTVLAFSKKDFEDHFTDDDAEPLAKIKIVSLPPKGTLKLNNTVLKVNDQIDAADLGNFTFVPEANWDTGTTSFQWNGSDGTDYADNPAKVTISVKAVNDPPQVFDFAKTGPEDKTLSFAKSDFIGVSAYLDVEGDPLVNVRIEQLPANGTLKLGNSNVTSNQTIVADNLDTLKFVPDADWSGTTFFVWNASDGQLYAETPAKVTITINPQNDAPQIDLNGPAGGTGYTAMFNSNAGPVIVGGPDMTVVDVDGGQLESAYVKIDKAPNGAAEVLTADKSGTDIKISYASGTRTLKLDGPDTIENFVKVLKTVTYDNSSDTPDTEPRTIRFQVYDGATFSNTAVTVVVVVNPRITLTVTPQFQTVLTGDTAGFTVEIVNSGDVDLENVTLTSPVASCNKGLVVALLPKGESLPAFSCSAKNVTDRIDNVMVVTADDTAGGPPVTSTSTAVVRVSNPNIGIDIAPDPAVGDTIPKGSNVTFNIFVLNPSASRLKDVTVTAVRSPLAVGEGPQSPSPIDDGTPVPECTFPVGTLNGNELKEFACTVKNVDAPFIIEAMAVGTVEGTNDQVNDFDLAQINILEILIQASANMFEIPAGKPTDVEFSITLTNNGSKPMTLTQLLSEDVSGKLLHGDLLDPENGLAKDNSCAVVGNAPVLGPRGGTYTCSYTATITTQALSFVNRIAVGTTDLDANAVSGSVDVILSVSDVAGVRVVLTANPPTLIAPGGKVELFVQIINNQPNSAKLSSLSDALLGDLDGRGDCETPQTIAANDSYTCSYDTVAENLESGQQVTYTVTAVIDGETLNDNLVIPVTSRGNKRVLLPSIANGAVAGEPNNSPCSAMPIMPNLPYFFLPDDYGDWYEVNLASTSKLKVSISNFVGQGQIILYNGDCTSPTILKNNGNKESYKEIILESAEPGRYFIWVITDSNTSTTVPYKLMFEVMEP